MNELIIPGHIAIIMDGNGRWANKRALPVKLGHRAGAETLRKITDEAIALSIKCLTAFAFSTENWKRPEAEVKGIMDLMNSYLDEYTKDAKVKNTKVRILGDISKLSQKLQEKVINIQEITENKTGLELSIAINYGGRDEITRAAAKLAQSVADGKILPEDITERTFAGYLDTAGLSDPDLFIRTGGETRVSNFLLWQIAYSELYFSEKLWPDFDKSDLLQAVKAYSGKSRRFGGR